MIPRATLESALPAQARKYLGKYIDPADAFLFWSEGLTPQQARSRARNSARSLGSSWPDHLPAHAIIKHEEAFEVQQQCGLHGVSPLEILEAVEAAEMALGGQDAALRLAAAAAREVDARAHSLACGITQRRAQQIKKSRVDLAALQIPLFDCKEEGEEGGEK